jgi:hypothetical protein
MTTLMDRIVDLAGELGTLSYREDRSDLARLSCQAAALAHDLHSVGELLAVLAGVEPRP